MTNRVEYKWKNKEFDFEFVACDDKSHIMFVTCRAGTKLTKYGDKRCQYQRIDIPRVKMKYLLKFLKRVTKKDD